MLLTVRAPKSTGARGNIARAKTKSYYWYIRPETLLAIAARWPVYVCGFLDRVGCVWIEWTCMWMWRVEWSSGKYRKVGTCRDGKGVIVQAMQVMPR